MLRTRTALSLPMLLLIGRSVIFVKCICKTHLLNFLYLFIHTEIWNCNCFTWQLTNKQEKTTEEMEA